MKVRTEDILHLNHKARKLIMRTALDLEEFNGDVHASRPALFDSRVALRTSFPGCEVTIDFDHDPNEITVTTKRGYAFEVAQANENMIKALHLLGLIDEIQNSK